MATWSTWLRDDIHRIDLFPGTFVTLEHGLFDDTWTTDIHMTQERLAIRTDVQLTPSDEEAALPEDQLTELLKARAIQYWINELSELAARANKIVDALTNTTATPDETGTHADGCGWDPSGRFCGECSSTDCSTCGVWARKKAEAQK